MNGFYVYVKTAIGVGAILGGVHGHIYRSERMKETLTTQTAVVSLIRDTCVGACLYPVLLPVYIVSPIVPGLSERLKQCPFSPPSNKIENPPRPLK